MAFRTDGLAKAYQKAQNEAIRIKQFAIQANAALAAGAVLGNAVIIAANGILGEPTSSAARKCGA